MILDVREAHELAMSKLPVVTHIPVGQIAQRHQNLPKDRDIVCVCHSGARSGSATSYLLAHGFTRVRNLEGGMMAWGRFSERLAR